METDNGLGTGYEHIMKIRFALELDHKKFSPSLQTLLDKIFCHWLGHIRGSWSVAMYPRKFAIQNKIM